jgi:serine/threonine protein kinase
VAETGAGESERYPRLGSMFGRYRIDSIIGRGGMGVVFRATDPALERTVALKFLTPELAEDPAFQARFLRESRLAAAIEHPNIVPIYEAGESGGIAYIAMRYIPGQDLGAILRAEAPLAVERALAIVEGLSDALDAAHRRGLVHRDVKPGNVLLESNGTERAYLVDFGLTRRTADTLRLSSGGLLGTIDYMAPEQIDGGTVDGRADQYALACLLFHCLAGSPPFGDVNEAAVLYGHVHRERPLLSAVRPDLGTAFDAPLARGMARNPDGRFEDCRAFSNAARAASSRGRQGAMAAASGVALGTAGVNHSARTQAITSALSSPRTSEGTQARTGWSTRAALAAVVLALAGGGAVITAATLLWPKGSAPGTVASASPAAPPSSALVAGGARSPSPTVNLSTGSPPLPTASPPAATTPPETASPSPLPPSSPSPSPSIGPVEAIVFASNHSGQYDLYRINADGSNQVIFNQTGRDERFPAISPDGRQIVFSGGDEPTRDLYIMNADGTGAERITSNQDDERYPVWSPDGKTIAFSRTRRSDLNMDIYLLTDTGKGFAKAKPSVLVGDIDTDVYPTWSPDGRKLAYAKGKGGDVRIWVVTVANPSSAHMLRNGSVALTNPVWSPDGKRILYVAGRDVGDRDIWVMHSDGSHPVQLTRSPLDDFHPAWSPDGSFIVYENGQFGDSELYVLSLKDKTLIPLTTNMTDAADPNWGVLVP